jgi:anthranilate phosphoribosyltransferase
MAEEMAARGRSALVFRGSDGLDELTTTGISDIWQVSGGEVRKTQLNPADLGLAQANLADLVGGDAQHNAQVAKSLFEGAYSGPVADIVRLNAAAGIVAFELASDPSKIDEPLIERFDGALQIVTEALQSGLAAQKLSSWMSATQS